MKKIWKYRFFGIIVIGQILMWCNITDTWDNNFKFFLWCLGIVISFVGVSLQMIIGPNYK